MKLIIIIAKYDVVGQLTGESNSSKLQYLVSYAVCINSQVCTYYTFNKDWCYYDRIKALLKLHIHTLCTYCSYCYYYYYFCCFTIQHTCTYSTELDN